MRSFGVCVAAVGLVWVTGCEPEGGGSAGDVAADAVAEVADGEVVGADTAVADTAVADTAVADTAVADTAAADTAVADTLESDVAVDTSPSADGCDELASEAVSALAAASQGCSEPLSCAHYEYPICGSFGCFQGAVREDADLAALEAAASAAGAAGCEPFHCGCGPAEGTPVCLDGTCESCPPDCGDSCDELESAFLAAAAQSASGCTHDLDCQITVANQCAMGPQLACHALAWRTDPTPALKLLDGWLTTLACGGFECDCQIAYARCDAGSCVPSVEPVVKCGTSVEAFPAFDDTCTDVEDCANVMHGTDCCGNAAVLGIRADEVAAFEQAEAVCQSQMAECACPAYMPVAEDGTSAWSLEEFAVRCEAGHCLSYVPTD